MPAGGDHTEHQGCRRIEVASEVWRKDADNRGSDPLQGQHIAADSSRPGLRGSYLHLDSRMGVEAVSQCGQPTNRYNKNRNATAIGPCVRKGRFVETQTCPELRSRPECREPSRMATTINNAKGAKTPFRIRSNTCGQLCRDADNSFFRPVAN